MFKYPGSKRKFAKYILECFPANYKNYIYCEVFFGMGNFFFQKPIQKYEIINDKFDHIINLFRVIKYNLKEFEEYFLLLNLSSISEYKRVVEKLQRNDFIDDIEKAYCYLYYSLKSFRGSTGKYFTKGIEPIEKIDKFNKDLIYFINDRLKKVLIENLDFRDFISKYDKENVLFYVDPPYYDIKDLYFLDFKEKDHSDLYNLLKNLKGKFILSYNDCEFVNNLYKDFYINKIKWQGRMPNIRKNYNELIITNYKINNLLFF
jgi:DNA adenine methylase